MRTFLIVPCLAALTGCGSASTYVHSDTTLGRVVVYRNGVAYFERTAVVDRKALELKVPADKVDDFLKSLTVVDARTGDPAPIAYPTSAPSSESGLIDMKITLTGTGPHALRVSYVTEAPSWKPSYRVVLGKGGKVSLQGWAIVDNTSGEDWENVQLGVGSSSALSFRFDLRSVRTVQRETLRSDDFFAQAPPMGGASYAQSAMNQQQAPGQPAPRIVGELSDDLLASHGSLQGSMVDESRPERKDASKRPLALAPSRTTGAGRRGVPSTPTRPSAAPNVHFEVPDAGKPSQPPQEAQIQNLARQLQTSNNQVIIEGYADRTDGDKYAASLDRANRAREQLIRNGVDPNRVVAMGNGEQSGRAGGVRIVEAPPLAASGKEQQKPGEPPGTGTEPIGTSHFESKSRMSVPRGTSAMVSILNSDTDGSVVYYYDSESVRGNASFPFRAVRIKNPTDSVLESGPVTVFGEGRFIGEGLSEPIPARSVAFVPFALDRQIMVERKDADADQIARIITVQRGVFSTEVQHTRKTTLTLTNRMNERAIVYVRHTVAGGYKLVKGPSERERIGSAYLFRAEVEPGGKADVMIEEATPLFKSTDIRATGGMELVHAFLSSAAEGQLKAAVGELLKLQKEMATIEQQIATSRDQREEYRARMDELHAQIVTLRAVKTAGPLMQNLEKKLAEVSDKLSKATIDRVGLQEKLMVAKIRFQDGIADLSLEKKPEEKAEEKKSAPKAKG